jgi:molybdopterin-guanine dinucleotide biosynthesis protein A
MVKVMTSIVLAGGKSLRLGRNKALEEVGGQSLIQRVIERLELLGTEVTVVVAQGDQLLLPELDVKMVADVYPGKGALGGIYSGLKVASSFHSLVVACDMPFLNIDLLRYLMELSPDFDVVIPRLKVGLEPLHAVYSKRCLGPMEAALSEGRLKTAGFFPAVRVRYVEQTEVEKFDPQRLSFFNINSEADLERARTLLEKEPLLL